MAKTFTTTGIVLKRANMGESDRMVTLLSSDYGKCTCLAKGARKLHSSKSALLEPGNYIKGFFVETKSLPLLTQVVLLDGSGNVARSLADMRSLYQVLEIFEKMFVEEALEPALFDQVLDLRRLVIYETRKTSLVRQKLGTLIESLGFQHPDLSDHQTITQYLQSLLAQPMRSFEYLKI